MSKYIVFCNDGGKRLGNVYVVKAKDRAHAIRIVAKEDDRFWMSAMLLSSLVKIKEKWSYF